MGFKSITVLFPVSRTRIKGLLRLKFQPDGELLIEGVRFLRLDDTLALQQGPRAFVVAVQAANADDGPA